MFFDAQLEFREQSQFINTKPLMYLWLHSAFVGGIEVLRKNQVDKLKDTVDADFQVIILFEPVAQDTTTAPSDSSTADNRISVTTLAGDAATSLPQEEGDDGSEPSTGNPDSQDEAPGPGRPEQEDTGNDDARGAVQDAIDVAEPFFRD